MADRECLTSWACADRPKRGDGKSTLRLVDRRWASLNGHPSSGGFPVEDITGSIARGEGGEMKVDDHCPNEPPPLVATDGLLKMLP